MAPDLSVIMQAYFPHERSLLDAIPVGIFRDDAQGHCVYANDRLSQLTGLSVEQMLGEGWMTAVHPLDRATVEQTWKAFVQQAKLGEATEFSLEYRYLRPNGTVIWGLGKAACERSVSGEIMGFIGTVTDISDRIKAETELYLSEERWQLVLQGSNDGIWDWDIRSNKVVRSTHWAAMFGYTEAEMQGDRLLWIDLLHPEDRDRVLQQQKAYLERQIPTYSAEYRLRCKDGSYKWVLSRGQAIWDEHGHPLRMAGTNTDIDSWKKAEAALRSSEEKFRELAENIDEVFFVNSADVRQLLYISPGYEKIWGRSVASVYQDPWSFIEAIHPDDRDRILQALDRQAQGKAFNEEYRIQHPNGEDIRWIFARSVPIRDESGQLVRHVGIAEDITYRKETEIELKQAKVAAEAANQAKSNFLAHMSHELRTPLNAILGFSQLMSRSETLTNENRKQLSIINRSGEHLLHLINDILEMSKIEAGKVSFQAVDFNLSYLLTTLEDMFRLKASQKGLQLIFRYDHGLPRYIRTDEKKLRQILINLLGNAIKFTQQGSVTLKVSWVTNQVSTVINQQEPIILRFEVVDTGVGIKPEEVELLFEPFVQARSGHVAYEGTGLGLSICRQFVNLMGGQLNVISVPNQGSTFSVQIPIQIPEHFEQHYSPAPRPIIGLAPDQPIYRILIVEDHPPSRELLRHLLETIGFQVQVAINGVDAIELWQQWSPDLIWMDMQLPILNGYEATLKIRQLENTLGQSNPTKIIALTASAFEDQRSRALNQGCDDFVRKPFQDNFLLEKISEHLGVTYLYQETQEESNLSDTQATSPLAFILKSDALKVMPDSWISNLVEASIQINSRKIVDLIQQIPPEHTTLATALLQKLDEFDIEEILHLAQSACTTKTLHD